NEGGVAGFVFKLIIKNDDGQITHIVSDTDWENFKSDDKLVSKGDYGAQPWGKVFDNDSERQRAKDPFDVLPGYRVEKLFTVPKEQLGSWVCIAEDNKGRLLASDQGNKGICRITLPKKNADGSPVETVVERLDFSGCEVKPSGAQGMLWAFDSLYISINGGPGSGFYRARDTDGDDKFDECVLLKKLNGGGEHGPHSLRLSPDGKRIFLIAGNHTEPPFRAGEESENSDYSSQIPTNWGEDLLLPRMWDANGHARGKLAPGGWIASTDPDGKTWDIWSIGYRNPYDMAFNADGELFAYDADMEWDVGSPWYRPTRVVHATRGSEFGWRSGTGKWPTHYLDSLPPMVDIGPGSPVGVDFGYGLDFPAKYQKALFICDWTFGTMYAIHIQPRGSSYTATKEEFVARNALPLTDVVSASDGALYFTIGGRGTQSELYRVTYVGNEAVSPTQLEDGIYRSDRERRREAESADGDAGNIADSLGSTDRFTRYSGIVNAYDNVPLPNRLTNDRARIAYLAALARKPVDDSKDEARLSIACNQTLDEIRYGSLSSDLKLDYLRAVSLCFIRKPAIIEPWMDRIVSSIESDYPSGNPERDRELCQLLVYLESPTVVEKTIELMKRESPRPTMDMKDLLSRNSGYARAFNAMMKNQPDKQQIWYAFCLRVAKAGWTPETRADYFRWFGKAQKWAGGNSFRKFLQNIENQAYEDTTENERVMLEALGARSPFTMPELPNPAGPGHKWELAEVRKLVNNGLKERNFANGKKMFAATRCVLCHRFAGDGGATGPDLTQLAGRFNVDALTEAIMEPSKVISDQYVASTVYTGDGKSVNGRIVSENSEQISVLTDPEDSTKVVDIAKENIEEITPSKASIMPSGLLDQLNENEVLDLFAYLLSRGDSRNRMFKKK
ncbi:MAG: c-type cytochrome, partial [Planctomycetota bacterium]